jgi:hypothetical protein
MCDLFLCHGDLSCRGAVLDPPCCNIIGDYGNNGGDYNRGGFQIRPYENVYSTNLIQPNSSFNFPVWMPVSVSYNCWVISPTLPPVSCRHSSL